MDSVGCDSWNPHSTLHASTTSFAAPYRGYLNDRGIVDYLIDHHVLGWNGERMINDN